MKILCIGGGAASFFFAANAARIVPGSEIIIAEQGKDVLQKVKISGGGRCNLTHHCPSPELLIEYYPRGQKELLGPFYTFGPEQTMTWFQQRGVRLNIEEDGRVFPKSNTSQSIIDCLTTECKKHRVKVWTEAKVSNIRPIDYGQKGYIIEFFKHADIRVDQIFIGSGSSTLIWKILGDLGHTIVDPLPSLFTFRVADKHLTDLSGIAMNNIALSIPALRLKHHGGPILITHKGLSGPGILALSALGAISMAKCNYRFQLFMDLHPDDDLNKLRSQLDRQKHSSLSKALNHFPKRWVAYFLKRLDLNPDKQISQLSKKEWEILLNQLKHFCIEVSGQNRFKEEFVTAGGVDLKEIDFSTFSSKIFKHMYLAGEVLNIDALTGGFNFQAAWTGSYIAASSV